MDTPNTLIPRKKRKNGGNYKYENAQATYKQTINPIEEKFATNDKNENLSGFLLTPKYNIC